MSVTVADLLSPSTSLPASPEPLPRRLGEHDAGTPGPTLIVTVGVHGNEPSGVDAARSVLAELEALALPFRGRLVVLVGNRAALAQGKRYLSTDLNRVWRGDCLETLRARPATKDHAEEAEMRDLADQIEAEIQRASGPVVLLDLHATSAPGAPFVVLGDTLMNRAVAGALPIPAVGGLNEKVEGALVLWMTRRGFPAIVVEGGCGTDPTTIQNHRAALWLVLADRGLVDVEGVPDLAGHYTRLKDAARGSAGFVVVRGVKPVTPADRFVMRPGYVNFQRVQRNEHLADDRDGPIRAPWDAVLLMPLYQTEGEDGFFLAREVPRSWLLFSNRARRAGLDRLLPSLPGISAHPTRPRAVFVKSEALVPLTRKFLTVFGYERAGFEDGRRVYARLPEPGEV